MRKHLWIAGKEVETARYRPLYAPYSGDVLAEIAQASEEDVRNAITAAFHVKDKMKKLSSHERAQILENVVQLLKENRSECAMIIAQEAAKPLKTAYLEVDRTIMTYTFASQEARRLYGESIPLDAAPGGENRVTFTKIEPIGVVAAITPFNFPMNLVAHKVGPAIAGGNTVVLKPASQTPLSALKIAELFHEAGLPSGALNVVTGSGSIIGNALVSDDRINMVTFTGSYEVGKWIRNHSGMKKVTLELGSNSACVIDDGVEIGSIIPKIVTGAFTYQGQVCISIQRIYVHKSLYEPFVEKLIHKTKQLTIGDPLQMETDISAMIHKNEVKRANEWIQEAVKKGAKIAYGGNGTESILHPTVLLNVPKDVKVCCEEVFAPIVVIQPFETFEEAIHEVNDSKYGLQAGVFTNSLANALYAIEELKVGGVMINDIPTYRADHMPYGGVKHSGMGREGIKYALEEMTERKLISFKQI